ncbi:MAG: hypothetical protein ACTSYD_02165 [Candidatus Heimdallarchaeaceae archaeon]
MNKKGLAYHWMFILILIGSLLGLVFLRPQFRELIWHGEWKCTKTKSYTLEDAYNECSGYYSNLSTFSCIQQLAKEGGVECSIFTEKKEPWMADLLGSSHCLVICNVEIYTYSPPRSCPEYLVICCDSNTWQICTERVWVERRVEVE